MTDSRQEKLQTVHPAVKIMEKSDIGIYYSSIPVQLTSRQQGHSVASDLGSRHKPRSVQIGNITEHHIADVTDRSKSLEVNLNCVNKERMPPSDAILNIYHSFKE